MAFYKYQSNISPNDRFDSITIRLDSGTNLRLDKGQTYDLTANEYQRARQLIVLVPSSAPAADTQKQVSLPVIGDLNEGDVPIWSESLAAFIPGGAGGGGGVSQSYVDTALATHTADTTAVHGITDTTALATSSSVTSAVATHEADTTSVHGITNTASLATTSSVTSAVSTHEADTTAVHGLSNTANCKGVAVHNGTSYPSRPTGFGSVEWIGPTDPGGSAQNGDTWVPTA